MNVATQTPRTTPATAPKWRLEGRDTFSMESYSLPGEYDSEVAARDAASKQLDELEERQPSRTSGGQSGIQDWVFIIDPQGNRHRYTG